MALNRAKEQHISDGKIPKNDRRTTPRTSDNTPHCRPLGNDQDIHCPKGQKEGHFGFQRGPPP